MGISEGDWVVCNKGTGRLHLGGHPGSQDLKFEDDSVGRVERIVNDSVDVWLIGKDETWTVPIDEVQDLALDKTGDDFHKKICNMCHRLLVVSRYDKNQTNSRGQVRRRPSCKRCRTDIEKRPPKRSQVNQIKDQRPKKGSTFRCPICQKRSIVGTTAQIRADHDRHTGNFRNFICDSCNTGLGKFGDNITILNNAILYIKHHDSLES